MSRMHFRSLAFLLAAVASAMALPPASIEGLVYRDKFAFPALRSITEQTLLFEGGRFSLVTHGALRTDTVDDGMLRLLTAIPSGTYEYTRHDGNSASIEIHYANGIVDTLALEFTSDDAGNAWLNREGRATIQRMFKLTSRAQSNTAPAQNVSMKARVSGGAPLVVGFVVPGERRPRTGLSVAHPDATARDILIRVVGPSLAQFGVAQPWNDPDFRIYEGSNPASVGQAIYSDWSRVPDRSGVQALDNATVAAFRSLFQFVGAFPLLPDSKDACGLFRLGPGAYTVVCETAPGAATGEALVEVYFLP